MEGLTTHAPMTEQLRARGVFDRHPFVLVDVGCAGGIDAAWRAFGPSLVAHGYDPDIAACEDAQGRESFANVRYHAAFVGLPETNAFVQRRRAEAERWPDTNIWGRITAGDLARRAQEATAAATPQRMADPDTLLGVDAIVRGEGLESVDFLKVDVDGPDVEVLESAREVLTANRVLGVGMEVNWFGSGNPTEHSFHTTDRFLREQGFTLFGLTFRSYSRTDLPAPFEFEFYAQTRFGQPYQGDAIYLRDLAAPHLAELATDYPPEKLIKLACIYELMGLVDGAAEVLNRFADRLEPFGDLEPLRDALTPPLFGEQLTYREYISRFENAPHLFLPSAAAQAQEAPAPPAEPPPPPPPAPAAAPLSKTIAARRVLGRVKRRTRRELGRVKRRALRRIRPRDRFAEMHRLFESPAFDLPLEGWRQLYDLTVAFQPDLVIELGRGWGNSTCVFTEAAQGSAVASSASASTPSTGGRAGRRHGSRRSSSRS